MKKNIVQVWWLAIRPKTLPAAVAPVLLGAGVALTRETFLWPAFFAAMAGAVLFQIAANLINDVADFERGTDTEDRLGPERVTQQGMLSSRQVWTGVWVVFGLAALAGAYLIRVGGWPILVIGLASMLGALVYTVGPYPLAYIGLGDVFVMIFFGFVAVLGTEYVIAGETSAAGWWFGAAVGGLIVNILVVNNIRDVETDREAGRKNIPVSFGRGAAEWEYALMLLLAYGAPLGLALAGLAPWLTLLSWLTLPAGYSLWRELRDGLAGPPLNPVLGQTAQLAFRYAALAALGFVLSMWL